MTLLAYAHGTPLEIFFEGIAVVLAVLGGIAVPLIVLSLLKQHTKV